MDLKVTARYGWVVLFYFLLITLLALERFIPEIEPSKFAVFILFVLPFVFTRLSRLKYGELEIDLRELSTQVAETRDSVKKSYDDLSERLAMVAKGASDYLSPQPLQVSDEKAQQLRETVHLTDEETSFGLRSLDANLRVPSYIELQVRPREKLVDELLDSCWLESFHSRRYKETRPLWQWLVAVGKAIDVGIVKNENHKRAEILLADLLVFMRSDERIDPGHQCEERTNMLLSDLTQVR